MPSVTLCYIYRVKAETFHEYIWYNSIPVLKKTVFTGYYSTLSLFGSHFIFLKWDGSIEANLGKSEYICFELFEV